MVKLKSWNRMLPIVIVLALLFQSCGLAGRWSGVSLARELKKSGTPAEALILRIWDTGIIVNDDPVVGFLLEVRPAGRRSYQARTKFLISRLDVPRIQPGTVVPVRIDPRDRERVALDIYEYR
jgi:hypothetical protein